MNPVTNSAASASKSREKSGTVRMVAYSALFAALTYVVFTYLSIRIPLPGSGQISIHLGNAFLVLGALLLGPFYGAVGGALGLTLADLLDPVYIVEAPVTFIVKFLIGFIAGIIAHKIGHIRTEKNQKRVVFWVTIASVAGLAFNAVFDPLFRYAYRILVLGKSAAELTLAINFGITLFNSVISLIVVLVLYLALEKTLRRSNLL